MMDAGTCSNVQGNSGGPDDGGDDKEATRRLIIQVKEEMERCLEAGMSKEQMFRDLREKGLHVAIAFAVYKELRDQNYGFFEEYYGKIDVRKQTERLQRLLHQYRTARDAAAGVSTLLMATPPTAMAVLENMGSSYGHTVVPVGFDDARLVGISSGDGQFAGSAPLQQAVQLPDGEQLHHSEHRVPNGGSRGDIRSWSFQCRHDGFLASAAPRALGSGTPSKASVCNDGCVVQAPIHRSASMGNRRCLEKSGYRHYQQRSYCKTRISIAMLVPSNFLIDVLFILV